MCFFSLHNENPPVNYATAEAMKVTDGLVAGERATADTLRAIADCVGAMASMVDAGGGTVAGFGELIGSSGPPDPAVLAAKAAEVRSSYDAAFTALEDTEDRISSAVQRYRELQEYAAGALAEGRGEDFERALVRLGTDGFDAMVERRIEHLREVKVRVQVLKGLQRTGGEILAKNDYASFFVWFMQPIRDLSIAVHQLYGEALSGALASHRAVYQTSRMVGEELPDVSPEQLVAAGAAFNGGNGASTALRTEGIVNVSHH
jgi:hypothetical protein